MWGQATGAITSLTGNGIIPTRVGTSGYPQLTVTTIWDHPHACGDKKKTLADDSLTVGSSPRVWGQESKSVIIPRLSRIIPTRVGTSPDQSVYCTPNKDHPHACGDKYRACQTIHPVTGSSPRVWGQVDFSCTVKIQIRIIPTRVGTRTSQSL